MPSIIKYYGDDTRWFIGTVTNIQDPSQLGRVQLRIFGLHNDRKNIPSHALPWAQVIIPVTEGGTSGIGTNIGIKPGAQVYGIFIDGKNSQNPIVIGSIPKVERTKDGLVTDTPSDEPKFLDVSFTDDTFLTGSTNFEKAYNFFRSDTGGGFSSIQTAGILGNLAVENGYNVFNDDLNPTQEQVGGGPGFGIAQWEGSRKTRLTSTFVTDPKTASAYSGGNYVINYKSLWAQVTYITYELDLESWNGQSKLKNSKSVQEASDIFLDYYERPAGSAFSNRQGNPDRESRRTFSIEFYNQFKKSGG